VDLQRERGQDNLSREEVCAWVCITALVIRTTKNGPGARTTHDPRDLYTCGWHYYSPSFSTPGLLKGFFVRTVRVLDWACLLIKRISGFEEMVVSCRLHLFLVGDTSLNEIPPPPSGRF
jgi:hypothetical protein